MTDHFLANPELLTILTDFIPKNDAAIRYGLINNYRAEVAPAWVRLSALTEANLRSAGIDTPGGTGGSLRR
ncbi:hypothetical protein O0S08_37415 [Nannocystis poenicansa]|uniref:Uncharacterized protein n=1 Tax=Nannocystis punicea TaxID=2995304 RepID=A0ABY7GY48_9BACT|nr:hypothetical protein [Nannocystis poenicansa]WAS91896.1 hypothetical protein O0S08_37415 [Nannocystis poenicansa]